MKLQILGNFLKNFEEENLLETIEKMKKELFNLTLGVSLLLNILLISIIIS